MVEKIQLEPDEHILLQVRKHWFVLLLQILSVVIGAVVPLFLYVIAQNLPTPPELNLSLNFPLAISLYTIWLTVLWMILFSIWTNYYLDVWTITSKRIIVADQRGFFFRTTASFRLERLQDIIVSINGILATLLDYGSVEIQTAGIDKNFKATGLPDPRGIKSTILTSSDSLIPNDPETKQKETQQEGL